MEKVLITDDVHPLLLEGFESDGFSINYQPKISLETVKEMVKNYEGLIINSKIIVDRKMLESAPKLRFIGRLGSGMEIIDQEAAREKGVAVLSAPEGNCNAVAEQALGMLLALANKLLWADQEVRQKIWNREKNRGFEIMGKTIGIIGFGHTGSAFARKLQGMGMKVLAYDKYKKGYATGLDYVEETGMETILEQADIISFHLPLTRETRHMVDEEFINRCKAGVIFINTSRGQVIKTEALIKGLENGKVAGACLDVFENEKPETFTGNEQELFQKLYTFKNTILSPHIAGWTVESKRRLAAILLNKVRKALNNAD